MGFDVIIYALQRALAQLPDPAFRSVLLRALGITIGTLLMAVIGLGYGVSLIGEISLPIVGLVEIGAGAGWVVGLGGFVLSGFLMLPVAAVVIGFFLEDIADAVEQRHYPDRGPAHPVPLMTNLRDSLRFLGIFVGANLLALLLYIPFAPFAPFIFYGLNGYLLGREYFQLVASRRLSRTDVQRMWRGHRRSIWALGTLLALPLSVPFLGLLIPLVGVAAFTHLFHELDTQPG